MDPRPVAQIIDAKWVIPVAPRDQVLENHSLVVDDGRIIDLQPTAEVDANYTARDRSERPNHALLPGFINAHTHAAMTLFRGLADDLPLMKWLQGHIWPAEGRWVNDAFVRAGTRLAALEFLRGGTTCFNDMYFYPDMAGYAAREFGMRAVVGLIVIEAPTVWAGDAREYIAKGTRVHDEFRGETLIKTAFAPHAPYTVSDDSFRQLATFAEELDVPIHIHVHETRHEVDEALANTGRRPIDRLAELGLLSPRLMCVHMTALDDNDIDQVADSGASVVHCPESNMKLASGVAPIARLAERGVNIALGTDGAASNNDLDMIGEMRTAALLAKVQTSDPTVLPAAAVLEMATLGGARALGLDATLGSLEVGKEADVIAVDLSAPELQPVFDPISQLVYSASREQVSDAWIAGRHVMHDRRCLLADHDEILLEARQWGERIGAADSELGA
jgi:5-methylthioadenosine/S-adenosylhomocysteine deaminase